MGHEAVGPLPLDSNRDPSSSLDVSPGTGKLALVALRWRPHAPTRHGFRWRRRQHHPPRLSMAAAKYHVGDRVEDAETGETGTVVHPPREYVIIVTASLIVGAICLAILSAFIVFFAPAVAHGVERLKQKISV